MAVQSQNQAQMTYKHEKVEKKYLVSRITCIVNTLIQYTSTSYFVNTFAKQPKQLKENQSYLLYGDKIELKLSLKKKENKYIVELFKLTHVEYYGILKHIRQFAIEYCR